MESLPRCQKDNSYKDPIWRQKELIPRRQQKKRGTPERESTGVFIPKGDTSWRQKELNSEVPAGQFQRSVQFLRRSELWPKGNISEVPAGYFRANGVLISNMGYKFWAQDRVYQDKKKKIPPLLASLFF